MTNNNDNKKELKELYDELKDLCNLTYGQNSFDHDGLVSFNEEEDEFNCREMLPGMFVKSSYVPMASDNTSSSTMR